MELDPSCDPFARDSIRHLVGRYGSPLLIIDAERVRAQYRRLAAALPGVDLHYALKPLPHGSVIQALRGEGAYFDLATNGEVDLVRRLGIPAERCIHTHPIKRDGDIRTALDYGVRRFVVDNPDEVRKFVKYKSRVSLLLRVGFRAPDAVCDLSKKFGCTPDAVAGLLALARSLDITIDGLSFHVGSQSAGPAMPVQAISVCRELMEAAAAGRQRTHHSRHRRRISGRLFAALAAHRGVLRTDSCRVGADRSEGARDRRTGPLHRGALGHLHIVRHGARAARRPLVVLPG